MTAVSPPPVVSQAVTKQLALPLYPGAQPTADGVHVNGPHASEIFAAYYRVNDPLAKVERYYVARLPKGSLKMYVNESDGGTADFAIAVPGLQKQVVLASDRGGTLIALSTTKTRGQK
ncbi:MAG TPA: hypothetical protein VKR99_08615 [Candidatus Eremiobacteraceae bacterium]|nr:hypothetical protein [Candidatus Eremiobacteraceae bacterium]